MSESINIQSSENLPLTKEDVSKWMVSAPEQFDRTFIVDGVEYKLHDAVMKNIKNEAGETVDRIGEVDLIDSEGNVSKMEASTFLKDIGYESDESVGNPETPIAILEPVSEIPKDRTEYQKFREELVFKPVESQSVEPDNYDKLFSPVKPDDSPEAIQKSIEKSRVVESIRSKVTPESKLLAEQRLETAIASDPELASIFSKFAGEQGIANRDDLTEELRTSLGLRLAVGRYLLDKIDKLSSGMPDRIKMNDKDKGANHGGYSHIPRMSSREYASLLAISMLDGTFDDNYKPSDRIEYHPETGEVVLGQHRAAAKKLISLT